MHPKSHPDHAPNAASNPLELDCDVRPSEKRAYVAPAASPIKTLRDTLANPTGNTLDFSVQLAS
jgi:hypothetical protein